MNLISFRVSDKLPLRKEVSHDSIEIFENESHQDRVNEDTILLKIISYDGRFVSLRLLSTTTIGEVKDHALTEFRLSINNERDNILNYKLLKPTEGMLDLNDSSSISENNLSDHGK